MNKKLICQVFATASKQDTDDVIRSGGIRLQKQLNHDVVWVAMKTRDNKIKYATQPI